MKLYLNTSALHRPFDDLSAPRVRTEADAVAAILDLIESGAAKLVASEYLAFEVAQNPQPEAALRVRSLLDAAHQWVEVSTAVADRARALERFGLRGLDALHIAAAEAAGAEYLVTTDDRMLRAARRAARTLKTKVVLPVAALAELVEAQQS